MKVFVIGTGGKTHSLIWKLAQSDRVAKIYCTLNNAVIKELAESVDIRENNTDELFNFVKENNINLTVVDSITAGLAGIADKLRQAGYNVFGPGKESCKLEIGRGFFKKLIHKYKIPTPPFGVFDKETQAVAHARAAKYPQVVKFDSRVPGLGTLITKSFNEAHNAVSFCLKNLYKPVVLEDFIPGKHFSIQVITDGYDAVPLPYTYVYKKLQEGNSGSNTEGMGAYSPVSFINREMESKIAQKIFFPLIDGLNSEKLAFPGVLKANIVLDDKNNPYLLGINVTYGDPETQTVMPVLQDDIFDVMMAASIGALADTYESLTTNDENSVCIMLVSEGYPGEYPKGMVVEGLEEIDEDSTFVFHGGTAKNVYNEIVTTAGRVLSIVSTAATLHRAYEIAYESVDLIYFKGMKFRKDIAKEKVMSDIKNF